MKTRVFAAVFGVIGLSSAAEHPLLNRLYDARREQFVDDTAFHQQITATPLLLIGEKHDNAAHAQRENDWIRLRRHNRFVFEMLDDSQHDAIATATSSMTIDELKAHWQWPQKGWDWSRYGALFVTALAHGSVHDGNISKAFIMQLYQHGEALLNSDRFASIAAINATQRATMLEVIFDAHCQQQSRDTLQPMLAIQLAKDASMAAQLVRDSTPATLIAGGEHTQRSYGVPAHIRAIAPTREITVVQLVEVDDARPQAADYRQKHDADFLVFTERAPEKDYCAGLRGKAAK